MVPALLFHKITASVWCPLPVGRHADAVLRLLWQHRIIPALRLKHHSGSCGTASALPKYSIMSGCGTRIVLRGAKAPRTLRPLLLLRFAVSATGGAHLCSIQYYLRFWLSSCRTSLAVSALRIMRYCLNFNFKCCAAYDSKPMLEISHIIIQ